MPERWADLAIWFGVAFAGLTALFTGLIWWHSWWNMRPHFALIADELHAGRQVGGSYHIDVRLVIDNRSRHAVLIDRIKARSPRGTRLALAGSNQEYEDGRYYELPFTTTSKDHWLSVQPGEVVRVPLVLAIPARRRSANRASISVRTITRSRVIRHRTKVATAVLPANTRKQIA